MVITAAAVGAVGAVGSTVAGMAMQPSGGGGGGTQPKFGQVPQNPQDKAMKDYFERMTVANANKTYPSFSGFLESGGAPDKAQFDLTMPGMKPSEAAAFGFVGGKGQPIPYVPYEAAASGDVTKLTPQQTLFLAQERAGQAKAGGQKPGPWASKVTQTENRLGRVTGRLEDLQATEAPTPQQLRKINRLTTRQGRLQTRQQQQLGGNPEEE